MALPPFAEGQFGPQFMLESGAALASYDVLSTRYVTAVDVIAGAIIANPMRALIPEDKDPNRRYAVNWRMDGNALDGRFNFATRVAVEVYGGPEHERPPLLSETRYTPSSRWQYLAGSMGRTGLYSLSIEARTATLERMMPNETMYDAPKHAKFFAKFLGDTEVRFKADPNAGEPLVFGPLRPFEDVLDVACNAFLEAHAPDVITRDTQQAFATAAAADGQNPNYNADSLTKYRQFAPGVSDVRDRIRRLADALYATNDGMSGALLTQLLDPEIVQVATLARHDSSKYFHQRNEQPGKATLHHRLVWVCEQASSVQTLAQAIVNPDVDGFGQRLAAELQSVVPVVNGIEMLQVHLRAPETIPMDDPNAWSVHPL